MIARLEGVLRNVAPTCVVVDVAGVGYEVNIPLSTFTELPDEGEPVVLRIYTHAREGAIQLFGFLTESERAAFTLLLRANRVGPKLAQTVLSGISPVELFEAIQLGKVAVLRAAPGVGSKMAERILLELRDRTGELAAILTSAGELEPSLEGDDPSTTSLGQALSALLNLGYSKPQADRALTRAAEEEGDDTTLEGLVRGSLRVLMK
ncbi:MAG: Holliday junction branch migration protein RuvA [Deltaproteobacteria bacterium]|nr:Holliday junction branch migration protein RuvA [Deltaproteobacteria bacterium]MBW2576726.1 Holliday junction branch migration protein RuvA [Deltaproteobacteria bacterium]MBW2692450.1 Holliday junction branch migration protein RuvA [Deltaproteobacteria bacterium]